MPISPPPASESTLGRRRALVAGAFAALSYFALTLIVRYIPPLQPSLSWLWLLLSGPGYLVLSLFQPLRMTPLYTALLLVSGSGFCFAVAATSTHFRRIRLAVVLLWVVVALGTTGLGLVFTIFALAEPLP